MQLYPFKTYYLKTTSSRKDLHDKILQLTFLSDEGFRRTSQSTQYFFGEVSEEEFYLETIDGKNRLVPYVRGHVRGIDTERYIFLSLRGMRHQRFYIVLLIFLALTLGLLLGDLFKFGIANGLLPSMWLALGIVLGISTYIVWLNKQFRKLEKNSLEFFRGMFDADVVPSESVPRVFKL